MAAVCGVSVGCIYNYFASKTELVSATVESIWNDIFHRPEDETVFRDTLACVRWMWLTIVLSFGFYIPVVLWGDVLPVIGLLMIPKTCAYVWTVLIGYSAMKAEYKKAD